MPTAQEMAMKFRERDERLEAIAAHARGDLDAERRALDALARREREERRPKNAGVHSDQNKKHRTKTNRRADKQELKQYRDHQEA